MDLLDPLKSDRPAGAELNSAVTVAGAAGGAVTTMFCTAMGILLGTAAAD